MNAEQQAAVERLAKLAGEKTATHKGHVLSNDIKAALSLITSLEADARRLDWIQETKSSASFSISIDEKFYIQKRGQVVGCVARNTDVRQAIDAAMKGAV